MPTTDMYRMMHRYGCRVFIVCILHMSLFIMCILHMSDMVLEAMGTDEALPTGPRLLEHSIV